jgi:hypothetical protein
MVLEENIFAPTQPMALYILACVGLTDAAVLVDISERVTVCCVFLYEKGLENNNTKKPNNNKNHTNDGMKAEYGWKYRVFGERRRNSDDFYFTENQPT